MTQRDDGEQTPQTDLVYNVDDAPRSIAHWLIYSGQWIVTMVYAVGWGYAIAGLGLQLQGPELSAYMGRVVLLVGLSTLAQAWLGHRFAMISGPNVVPSLALVAAFQTGGREYALEGFTAQALAGVVVLVLALTGAFRLIRHVWSPLVLGSMIMVVGLSVASVGLKQMAGGGFTWPFWVAVALSLGGMVLSIRGRGIWATLTPLFIIGGGYVAFALAGQIQWERVTVPPLLSLPQPFPFGMRMPPWDLTLTMTVVGLMSALNLYGNLHGYAEVVKQEVDPAREKRSFAVFAIVENIAAGVFGVPGCVSYGENLGIVMITRVAARAFVLAAAALFTLFAFFGPMAGLMAAMPLPVAGAVLLGIASTVIGLGGQTWTKKEFGQREIAITGFSVFLALGLSLLPPELWRTAPRIVATVFSNPIITVILLVMLLEQVVFRAPAPEKEPQPADQPDASPSPASRPRRRGEIG